MLIRVGCLLWLAVFQFFNGKLFCCIAWQKIEVFIPSIPTSFILLFTGRAKLFGAAAARRPSENGQG
jgi:hypothetical protein